MRPRKDPARPQKSGGADSRQVELFGAAWLAASIGACITARLSSCTVFSTLVGSEGIMSDDGGVLYPVYQVLRTGIARAKRAAAVRLTCGESIVAVVAFATPAENVLLIVNGTPVPDTIALQKVPAGTTVAQLDDTSVASARKDPDFWEHEQRLFAVSAAGTGTLHLPPYGLARLVVPGVGFGNSDS